MKTTISGLTAGCLIGLLMAAAAWGGAAAPGQPAAAGADDFRGYIESILRRMDANQELLGSAKEGAAFFNERTAKIRKHLEALAYGRAWQEFYAWSYWAMARRLGSAIEFGSGPLRVLAVTAGENAVRWEGELVLRDRGFDIWFANDNPVRPVVQIRSFLTSRQYWPADPIYESGTDVIRTVAWASEYFHKTITVETERVIWDIRVSAPFGGGPVPGGAFLACSWCSSSPRFWNCPVTMETRNGESNTVQLPAIGAAPRGNQRFDALKAATFASTNGHFKLTVEPIGACSETFKGMTAIGNPHAQPRWSFGLAYAPPGKKWPAGELAHFRIVFEAGGEGRPAENRPAAHQDQAVQAGR